MIPEERSTTGKTSIPELARELLHLPLAQVVPSDTNPRLNLEKESLEELKQSIYANGLLQPIVVRPKGDVYEIIGGHRRYFALQQLAEQHKSDKRFTRIAVVVVHVPDALVPVLQLAENINRSDLSCVEIAEGVARTLRSGIDTTQLAGNLGWSRRKIGRYAQLAEAPQWMREFAKEVKVTKKKQGPDGKVVIDTKTDKPVLETERYPGLHFSDLGELIDLYSVLREADVIQLEEGGGEHFRPQAERTTKRLAIACAVEGWSKRRLREEIKRAKDPKPREPTAEPVERKALDVNDERCVIDLKRALALQGAERAAFAAQLMKVLARLGFKNVSNVA